MSRKSVDQLETLFIEKLEEKLSNLSLRTLKKAFANFDRNGNGLLDLDELSVGIGFYLNGVEKSDIKQLVKKYDANKDGTISYEEFLVSHTP